ncbi:hypothetical protein PHET_12361 [Paragonimus heterotremus]|uniref:ELM2 domain-containing protein n=1 Tax=Paragonimus heterotremus TaxID=100268 RepID=A0A8J4T096_9TREM|nr:hypothetical protein PHET_12361 [Paragonimus heterotremus]
MIPLILCPLFTQEIRVGDEYQAHVPPSVLSNSSANISDWWDTKRIENDSCRLWQPGKLLEEEVVHFERLFAQTVMFPLPNERTMDDEEPNKLDAQSWVLFQNNLASLLPRLSGS